MRFSQPDAPHSMFPHMQALPCTSLHFSMTQSTGIRRRPFPSYGTNGRLQTLHLNEESCSEVKLCAPMNFKPSLKKKKKKKQLVDPWSSGNCAEQMESSLRLNLLPFLTQHSEVGLTRPQKRAASACK